MNTKEYNRKYYLENRNKILEQRRKYCQENRGKKLECQRKWGKKNRKEIRYKVLYYYSKGKLECACCKEKIYEFLSIDHINGGGAKHSREINRDLYGWLIRNNFPSGFQVLCHNCNFAKGHYGKCPHERFKQGRIVG